MSGCEEGLASIYGTRHRRSVIVNTIAISYPVVSRDEKQESIRAKGKLRYGVKAIAIVALLSFAIGWVVRSHYTPIQLSRHEILSYQPTTVLAATNPQTAPAAEIQEGGTENTRLQRAAQLRLAVIQKGDGVESSLIRQLVAFPTTFGFTGDLSNAAAIKAWAGRTAHRTAIAAGYVDWKFGAEIRVKNPGTVAYLLKRDESGKLRVVQSAIVENSFEETSTIQASASGSQFLGMPGHEQLQSYEYLYTGE